MAEMLANATDSRDSTQTYYIQISRQKPGKELQKSSGKFGKHSIHPDQWSPVTRDLRRVGMAGSNPRDFIYMGWDVSRLSIVLISPQVITMDSQDLEQRTCANELVQNGLEEANLTKM